MELILIRTANFDPLPSQRAVITTPEQNEEMTGHTLEVLGWNGCYIPIGGVEGHSVIVLPYPQQ